MQKLKICQAIQKGTAQNNNLTDGTFAFCNFVVSTTRINALQVVMDVREMVSQDKKVPRGLLPIRNGNVAICLNENRTKSLPDCLKML